MSMVGRHRHYLGSWSPAERVRIAADAERITSKLTWHAPDEKELAELVGDDPVLAAITVPRKIRSELWELDWDEGDGGMTPRDQDAFAAYGRRVMGFLRSTGLVAGAGEHGIRLVASAPGVTEGSKGEALAVLMNVGEVACAVAVKARAGAVALEVPPDEGCAVASVARPWTLVVPDTAEFGLFLEVG